MVVGLKISSNAVNVYVTTVVGFLQVFQCGKTHRVDKVFVEIVIDFRDYQLDVRRWYQNNYVIDIWVEVEFGQE
jgi:hypothetical protein